MATATYRLKKLKNNNSSIYLRFKQGNLFDTEISTGVKIPTSKWSNKLQKINQTIDLDYKAINLKLTNLKTHISNEYSIDSLNGAVINNSWLKIKMNAFFKKVTNDNSHDEKIFFISFLKSFIEEAHTRVNHPQNPIKYKTIQHYNTTKNKLINFEKHYGKRLRLEDISLTFHGQFIDFLEKKEFLNPNTIGGYIDVVKRVCGKASIKGYNINNDYKTPEFYTPSNKTLDTYLSNDEIHTINNYVFDNDYLDNARDWLVISVWSGLRVSDLLSLTKKNIEGDFIKKDTLKTNFPVIIPIHQHVKFILNKRNGDFPRTISDQKYNKYIKEVCRLAGITETIRGSKMISFTEIVDGKKKKISRKKIGNYSKYELISSHIGRRSFATNHYGKLDTLTLMKITGHKTEKQFLDYIKVTPQEYADKLKNYWDNIDFSEFINS